MNEYVAVTKLLTPVLGRGRAFEPAGNRDATPLAKEIGYGVLRDYFRLDALIGKLLEKPLATKHLDVRILLLAGLYSVVSINRPAYASVNAAVEAAPELGKPWARGLVNGVLRNYLRQQARFDQSIASLPAVKSGHPDWLTDAISTDWPAEAMDILHASNRQAPMTLRVNTAKVSREDYLARLAEAGLEATAGVLGDASIYLADPVGVDRLPGFSQGLVSVQDEGAQLAAPLLAPAAADRILDACAAPGGKTCHLLELAPDAHLVAIDIDEGRLEQVRQNLARLSLDAHVARADVATFAPDAKFTKILLDAPCSATGVMRRHPDIKLLRRESDIAKLKSAQLTLLRAVWQMLEGGGVLLYSTCSVLKAENDGVIEAFIAETPDAHCQVPDEGPGIATQFGRQLLPTVDAHDGFYYSLMHRRTHS